MFGETRRFRDLVRIFQQPIMEAIHNGPQRRLIQVAAHSRRGPRFVTVSLKADRDANMDRKQALQ